MKTQHIPIAALTTCLAVASGASSALLNLTFTGQTVGNQTPSASYVTPATPVSPATPFGSLSTATGHVNAIVIGSANNAVLNSGEALRLFDHSTSASPAPASQNVSIRIPLVSSTDNAIISFRYTGLVPSDGNTFVRMTFGGGSLNAASTSDGSTGNFARIAFSSINSTSGFTAGNITADQGQANPNESVSNFVQLFVNRKSTPLNYDAPSGSPLTIAANSYHVWLNGVQQTTGAALAGGNFSMTGTLSNITHIGFGTGGGQGGADWVLDDITVAVVPEPAAAIAIASLAGLGLARRRRR
jgi:hypothetical protein